MNFGRILSATGTDCGGTKAMYTRGTRRQSIKFLRAVRNILVIGSAHTGRRDEPYYATKDFEFNEGEHIPIKYNEIRIFQEEDGDTTVYFEILQDTLNYSCAVRYEDVEIIGGNNGKE